MAHRLMMRIIALDPGKVTGFAEFIYWNQGAGGEPPVSLVSWGCIADSPKPQEWRVLTHYEWLMAAFSQTAATSADGGQILVWEAPILSHALPGSVEAQEVRGVLRLFAAGRSGWLAHAEIHPATIKAYLAGKGNANKKLVAEAVTRLTGIPRFKRDHEPDAIAVGLTYLKQQFSYEPARDGLLVYRKGQ